MQILHYPHPALRRKCSIVRRVDAELRETISEMYELMYEANGIGLAANQVDLPLRFFIVNTAGDADEGEELVFINPVLSQPEGRGEEEEGCLSIPTVYGKVMRPTTIHVQAYNFEGQPFSAELSETLARVVQHETDHLDGVLFTDRISPDDKPRVDLLLEEFAVEFADRRGRGEIPADEDIYARLDEIQQRYCAT